MDTICLYVNSNKFVLCVLLLESRICKCRFQLDFVSKSLQTGFANCEFMYLIIICLIFSFIIYLGYMQLRSDHLFPNIENSDQLTMSY